MTEQEFTRRFTAAAERKRQDVLGPYFSPEEYWVIMSMLQLALRHPGNIGPSSKIARGIVDRIQRLFAALDPELGRLAERGNHAVFDQERTR